MGKLSENHRQAYDELQKHSTKNTSRIELIRLISEKFSISESTVKKWVYGTAKPWGRNGEIVKNKHLAYVIGALLGDGCLYKPKQHLNYVILCGSKEFSKKFATQLNKCNDVRAKAYPNRRQNIWFVKVNNYQLFTFFEHARKDVSNLLKLLETKNNGISFIEGFFDAEGCVKIVGKKRRKTPKICLDICNTDKRYLDLTKKLFEEHLKITTHYSNQDAYKTANGYPRKKAYHLRIYKKSAVRDFFKNIHTTKLKDGKEKYLEAWLNNGLGS